MIRPGHASPSMLRRFELEAQLLGRLQDPGIAQVFAAGTLDGPHGPQPFLAMERIDGERLDAWSARERPSARRVARLVARLADAVQHAHQKGVLHRDLKPANVLVTADGSPKIVDFGIAREAEAAGTTTMQTQPGQIIGTLAYMAPEQLAGDPDAIDSRCDVYALGVILYQLLAGQPPLQVESEHIATAVRRILEEEPTPLGKLDSALRGDLETIAEHALAKDAARRYPTAAALADDLRRYLGSQPVLARPATRRYRITKFVRRHRVALALSTAFVLALVTGLAGTLVYAVREQDAREHAEAQRDLKARINDILVEILASASPFTRGANAKVVDVLREVEGRLEGDLIEDPEVEAPLRLTLARAYRELGLYDEARASARRADELFTALRGADHVDSIVARAEALRAALVLHEPDLSERFEALVAHAERALGPDHRETLQIRGDLLATFLFQDRGDLVVELSEELLRDRRRALGEDHEDVARALDLLSRAYSQSGDLAKAEAQLGEAIALMTRLHGPRSAKTLQLRLGLASLVSWQRRSDEARTLIDELVEDAEDVFGAGHWAMAELLTVQGTEYSNAGDAEQAIPILEEAVRLQTDNLGPRYRATMLVEDQLGIALRRAERFEDAEQVFRRVLDKRIEIFGPESQQVGGSWVALGVCYRHMGRKDDALACYRRCEEIDRKTLPEDHPDALWTQSNLATILIDLERHDEAEAILRRLVPLRRAKLGDASWVVGRDYVRLAQCLIDAGKHADAAEVLREALQLEEAAFDGQLDQVEALLAECESTPAGRDGR